MTAPTSDRILERLGRLHPKKNLSALIEAWPADSHHDGWHLAIAGWDQGGHRAELENRINRLQPGGGTDFKDALEIAERELRANDFG